MMTARPKCAFEQAHQAGEIEWQKPISCHLYPIRLTPLKDLTAVNYPPVAHMRGRSELRYRA